ncbi:hypothetical protein [Oceanobacillus alkalisoli]|uniref:hypothetical protein n=1 Tax=Oceanobacillus alkalisoli TaxID=2925113 RepID=UPI001F1222B2|nr:hypothetical protein [Oceanobacillus alkalisoli]MCF3944147.1 hypothetical protein [Oceanobacillus alkalisoli]
MKILSWKSIAMLLILTVLLVGCGISSAQKGMGDDEVIELRVGTGVPTTHIINQAYFTPWLEAVEKETNGKVQFETHYGGSLVAMGREYDALESGIVDIVLPMFQMYDPVRFPLSEVSMLPVMESDVYIATKAYEELVLGDYVFENGKTFYEMEHGSKGLKQWTSPTTEGYKFSYADISEPQTISEFANVTFRSSGRMSEIFSKNIGINAISIPAGDIYDSLSRGSIDGLYFSIPDWPSYGIGGLFNYTIDGVNLGHFSHTYGMTQETWDSLPKEVQQIMDEQARKLLHDPDTYEIYEERTEDSLRTMEAAGGMIAMIDEQPQEIQEAVDRAIVDTWKDWIEMNEEKGFPGKETALLWRDLIIKHGGSVPTEIEEMK